MAQRPDPKDLKLSLLAGDAAARQAVLERMRGKLAGRPADAALRAEGRRKAVRRKTAAWAWRVGLTLLFLGANVALVVRFAPEAAVRKVRTAPAITAPRNLSVNDQALYWTYALYDFDRLKSRFGAPAGAVVDAAEAKRALAALLPRVDARTRFAIDRYLPKGSRA